eukprot:SAG11_NODE_1880_length_4130_cov_2.736046_2_plen_57_part_00
MTGIAADFDGIRFSLGDLDKNTALELSIPSNGSTAGSKWIDGLVLDRTHHGLVGTR